VFHLYAWGDNSKSASHKMNLMGISVSDQTVKAIFKDIRNTLFKEFCHMREARRLGGPGCIVEIDESMFGHDSSAERMVNQDEEMTIFDKQVWILGFI
jgi:hypothetical protein